LYLEHAGNEKEFMPELKCLCAVREMFMSTMKLIVVITMKNIFYSMLCQLLASVRNWCRQYCLPKEEEGNICKQFPGGKNINHGSDLK
jgi:hypothetical protein